MSVLCFSRSFLGWDLVLTVWEGINVWGYKPGQKTVALEVTAMGGNALLLFYYMDM